MLRDGPADVLVANDVAVQFKAARASRAGDRRPIKAVDGVDIKIARGETLGLVGESGSGKSTLARSIMGLTDPLRGRIWFEGHELTARSRRARSTHRLGMQMVFQSPGGSLNPSMRVGSSIAEPLRVHGHSRSAAEQRVNHLLSLVGLDRSYAKRLPRELSGGEQQRVGIARALALDPTLLILDEPVSALDVSVQAQILNLLLDLQDELGLSYLLISHDLSVVSSLAHRVAVMFLGRIVETGPPDEITERAFHPYTQALISAIPIAEPSLRGRTARIVLSGDIPSPRDKPTGCSFRTRCWRPQADCESVDPPLTSGDAHSRQHACLHPSMSTEGAFRKGNRSGDLLNPTSVGSQSTAARAHE